MISYLMTIFLSGSVTTPLTTKPGQAFTSVWVRQHLGASQTGEVTTKASPTQQLTSPQTSQIFISLVNDENIGGKAFALT